MKLRRVKPPQQLLAALVVLACAAMFGGALFCVFNWDDVARVSERAARVGRAFAFELGISPLSGQTLSEAFFVTLILLLTVGGLALMYDGAAKPREAREALTLFLIGFTLLIIGLAGWWWLAFRILT
jgi:glycerol uptake facilitator-like aquaporin